MKPEKSLLIALFCTFCVLLYQRISEKGSNLYNIIVFFSVVYFISASIPSGSFFKKEPPEKKENPKE